MTEVYKLFVPGIPKAQPRPRMTKAGHVYTPDSAKAWKDAVSVEFLLQKKEIINQPVKLTVCFFLPIPKSRLSGSKRITEMSPHTGKPDSDNLLKAVMDAMSAQKKGKPTAASVWTDDALVFSSHATKRYTAGASGAMITVEV